MVCIGDSFSGLLWDQLKIQPIKGLGNRKADNSGRNLYFFEKGKKNSPNIHVRGRVFSQLLVPQSLNRIKSGCFLGGIKA